MRSSRGCGWAAVVVLAGAIGVTTAHAQAAETAAPAEEAEAPATETESASATEAVDINELDWSQLDVDYYTLMTTSPPPPKLARRAAAGSETTWSSRDQPNGSAVSVKQSISPFWDARVGADMTVVRQPTTLSELLEEKATNGGSEPQSSGQAWAAITAPGVASIWDKTAVEARVDPSQDQSRLGTFLSKSLTLSEQYSLTLQNGYNFMQQGIVPAPGAAGHPLHSFETEQSARLNITESGTSFSAGQTLSSTDDKWLRKIGAEQKLTGGFSVSGSISETPFGTANKSISAGFKQSW